MKFIILLIFATLVTITTANFWHIKSSFMEAYTKTDCQIGINHCEYRNNSGIMMQGDFTCVAEKPILLGPGVEHNYNDAWVLKSECVPITINNSYLKMICQDDYVMFYKCYDINCESCILEKKFLHNTSDNKFYRVTCYYF